jgi:hypothetical protein
MPIGLSPGSAMHHIAFFWSLPKRLAASFRAQSIDAWRAQVIQANAPSNLKLPAACLCLFNSLAC